MTNALRLSLGIAGAALLIGCNKTEPAAANAAHDTEVAANTAVPVVNTATPAATPAAAGALSTDYMVGKWSAMNEDCADTLEFRKDGSMVTPMGNAKWALDGDKLVVDFGDGAKQNPSSIKVLSPDRIEITKGSGGKETQKRC
mgnify:CR=1 FL=1